MKRYNVPRIAFINKLDRQGSDPAKVTGQLRERLDLNAVMLQLPIGLEESHKGVVDLVNMKAVFCTGEKGDTVEIEDIPANMVDEAETARLELVENLADLDDELGELYLMEEEITPIILREAIRRQTILRTFVPVMMGSAFKNKGVQPLLDGVLDYLPNPAEVENTALDLKKNEEQMTLPCDPNGPLVALAFKLEDGKFGQLTYTRIYSGTLSKSQQVTNVNSGKRVKVPRIVRMHSDDMEDVDSIAAGDVAALFGIECNSMDSFTDGTVSVSMTSMHVPEPVMSLAVKPDSKHTDKFSKAVRKFMREDPTFRIMQDPETNETVMSGMGELHLEIYIERMKREYDIDCESGAPKVNYRETLTQAADFDFLHKKQTGGQGQFARVIGRVEPIPEEEITSGKSKKLEFVNKLVGNNIPPEYVGACQKGMMDAAAVGPLVGCPIEGMRVIITDGVTHPVDSSEMAFRTAMVQAVKQAFDKGKAKVMEPIMSVEVTAPAEFQGSIVGGLNKRRGMINNTETTAQQMMVEANIPLAEMFGYSTTLRSSTQGMGEFSMEFKEHAAVSKSDQEKLMKLYQEERYAKSQE